MIAVFWARPQFEAPAIRALGELLEPFERERSLVFREPADRNASIVSHGLLRLAVLAQTGRRPDTWRLSYSAEGRPLAVCDGESAGFVSLAHTRAYVAVAYSSTEPLGVDIEDVQRTLPDAALMRAALSPAEEAALLSEPESLRASLFAATWTRREAAFKSGDAGLLVRTWSVAPAAVISLAGGGASSSLEIRQFDERAIWRALQSARSGR